MMENNFGNPYTNQIFQEAVERSDFAIVRTLLRYGVYLRRNQRNRNRLTALQQSVLDGNGRMAILLLESGADIEAKTSNGWTSLHIAAALGDLDILATLINHCASLSAITKNEELPIDLAATREIKIKLAKEMSRVGYSELAQWYMKKLAAREGAFYVLSANHLLDLACDDNYDKSYSSDSPCFLHPEDEVQSEVFMHDDPNTYWHINQDNQTIPFAPDASDANIWMEQPPNENPTYLSYSSGYISEVVFDPNSGEYSKVRRSVSMSSGSSPRLKYPELVVNESKTSIASVITPEEEDKTDNTSRYGSLARSGTSRRSSRAQVERSNTIELLIDYSNYQELDDTVEDVEESATLENINPSTATIDESEECLPSGNHSDKHASNELVHLPPSDVNKSTLDNHPYKRNHLSDSFNGTIGSSSKGSESQYELDMYDSYHVTPVVSTSSLGSSSTGNEIPFKSEINEGYQMAPITRGGNHDNQYNNGSHDNQYNNGSHDNQYSNGSHDNQYSNGSHDNQYSNGSHDNQYSNASHDNQYNNGSHDNQYNNGSHDNQYNNGSHDNQYNNDLPSCDSYHTAPNSLLASQVLESQDSSTNSLNARYRRYTDTPDINNYEMKARNVRFDASDAANEFCNCPNCKKLGYAFSPDIRSTGRRVMHFGDQQVLLPQNQVMSEVQLQKTLEMMQSRGYPNSRLYHDDNGDKSLCYTQNHPHKPRKRKKKLFSGIRSIFKDSIKVQRGGIENSPVVDDAGILFAFSLRDRSKAKEIKNRYDVRRSNSFSGCASPQDMVSTYTHDQVVPPPMKFSDTYGDGGDPRKKVFNLDNMIQMNNGNNCDPPTTTHLNEHDGPHFKQDGPHFKQDGSHFKQDGSHFKQDGPHFKQDGPHFKQDGSHFKQDGSHFKQDGPHFKQDGPHFKQQLYHDGGGGPDGGPSQMSDISDESSHVTGSHHMSAYINPLYETQSVIEERDEFNACACDSTTHTHAQSITEENNISNMMSKMKVHEKDGEKKEEGGKFNSIDGGKNGCPTKEAYVGKSL